MASFNVMMWYSITYISVGYAILFDGKYYPHVFFSNEILEYNILV